MYREYLRITRFVRFFDYKKEPAGEPTVLTKRGEDSEWTKQTNKSKWNKRPGRQRPIKYPGRSNPENEKGGDPAATAYYPQPEHTRTKRRELAELLILAKMYLRYTCRDS